MINYNGNLLEGKTPFLTSDNRGLKYGDALFETLRVVQRKIYFWEAHYLRLMASMRILRMEIPMQFTMEFLQEEILKTVEANGYDSGNARVRLTIFRKAGGFYLPDSSEVEFLIDSGPLKNAFYEMHDNTYEIELFKDFYTGTDLLATLKTTNRLINTTGSIFAAENDYQNCLLMNQDKNITEALNGNLFLVKANHIKTPPLSDGCLKGIIRSQLIDIVTKLEEYTIEEASISPFELQKADELFITNTISGIQPVTKYRKKTYKNTVSKALLGKLNAKARLT